MCEKLKECTRHGPCKYNTLIGSMFLTEKNSLCERENTYNIKKMINKRENE